MQESPPRYEFRAFAQNFGIIEEKMQKLSKLDNFRESSEIYQGPFGISPSIS